jgi:hypothetical protein
MLDVVNQQLLMLHLVLKPEPYDSRNLIFIITRRDFFDEAHRVFIDVRAIFSRLSHSRPRTRPALRPLNARTKSFVVGIEIEKKIFAVSFVSRLEFLQHRLEEPRRVADVPARRRHELRRLNHVVFDLQRRDDFQRARADRLIEIGYGLRLWT